MTRFFKLTLIIILVFFSLPSVFADDTGITTTRLIQDSETSYIFEIEANQLVLWAIKTPVFPDRFTVYELEHTEKAGQIVLRFKATTSGESLNHRDVILLPWVRNGVSITAQWKDGTLSRGFFRRSIDGILIPMNALMTVEKTNLEIGKESFELGLKHIGFGISHFLLVLALFLVFKRRDVFINLLWYAFGHGFSLILIEFNVPGFDLLFTEFLVLLLVFMLCVSAYKDKAFDHVTWILLFLGLFHGFSANEELQVLNPDLDQRFITVFMFDLAVDVAQFGIALLLFPIVKFIEGKRKLLTAISSIIGVGSIVIMIGLFNNKVLTGKTSVIELAKSENLVQNSLPTSQGQQSSATPTQGAVKLTTPIMSYLSVEPFEVRHEILVNAGAALDLIAIDDSWMGSIPEDVQEEVKQKTLGLFLERNSILVDGAMASPVLSRVDFVTLGPTGVFLRPEPVRESFEEGIIAISLVYETETLANTISVNWGLFSNQIDKIEATAVDPFGGESFVITPDDHVLEWKQTLSGYAVPKVERIAIQHPKLPIASIFLILFASVLMILSRKKYQTLAIVLLGIALLLYPFVRVSANIPWVNTWKPSKERSTKIMDGLLTNVYRSFDYRNEAAVYDRLSISVMGDQLTQTYIEQRKGLEIENRGGASAKVNDVDVIEIHDVIRGENGSFGIEISWKINGSVSHFGHMHYRQNRYHGIIWIVPENGNWKIQNIAMLEEERLM